MRQKSEVVKVVIDRIKRFEEAIAKGTAYLESGQHANWSGFRPLFARKRRGGKELPPHREWVKNVFLRNKKRSLSQPEKLIEKLTSRS